MLSLLKYLGSLLTDTLIEGAVEAALDGLLSFISKAVEHLFD
ncbi:hypothetical protein Q5H93_12140 [Hymenobacter sp. ASUV-10]|uniref:Uncharacterized protein n=1 Tax=Hymenobacter aranciens TaxID=3063996 RepID=A0ABT9BCQ7_9BACT|nr:hypothetical protein [Hymenobacter sp. ASUV-10]MDO7875484.1 hypothetical protein [Hymenobacter sp. ASUV-10]